jgi:hypothetical protein
VDTFDCGSIGQGATISDVDNGGKGNDSFSGVLFGEESSAATVTLKFTGGDGDNTGFISDSQHIDSGATTTIDLRCKGDTDDHNSLTVQDKGVLQGRLNVTADAGQGTNTLDLEFTLDPGSKKGFLNSAAQTGPGPATVTDTVHKAAADSPVVTETATAVGKGTKTGTFTDGSSPTTADVIHNGFLFAFITP